MLATIGACHVRYANDDKQKKKKHTLMTSEDKGCMAPVHFMSCNTPMFLPLRYILLRAARTAGSRFTHSGSCLSHPHCVSFGDGMPNDYHSMH